MRYDTPIYFCKSGVSTYNSGTGDYDTAAPVETERMASVMDTNEETMRLLYGQIRQGGLMIQLQNHYDDAFDYIRIGTKKYTVNLKRSLRIKQTLYVSEAQ